MELSGVLNPDALQFRSEFGVGLAAGNGLVAVGTIIMKGRFFRFRLRGKRFIWMRSSLILPVKLRL